MHIKAMKINNNKTIIMETILKKVQKIHQN